MPIIVMINLMERSSSLCCFLNVFAEASPKFDWLRPERRDTDAVENIGGTNVPVVIVSELPDNSAAASDNNTIAASANPDLIPDYIYVGENLPENRPANQK